MFKTMGTKSVTGDATPESLAACPSPVDFVPDWKTYARELHCHRCAYNLRWLTGSCCPECGSTLDWRSLVVTAESREALPLFEYQWRKRPLRSFCHTLRIAFRPKAMLSTIPIEAAPSASGLAMFGIALLALLLLGSTFLDIAAHLPLSLRNGTAFLRKYGASIVANNLNWYGLRMAIYALMGATALPVLMIFGRTLTEHRVSTLHLCRILLIAFSTLVVIRLVQSAVSASMSANGVYPDYIWRHMDWIADVLSVVCFYRTLAWGLRSGCLIRRGREMAVLTLGVVGLAWHFAVIMYTIVVDTTANMFAYVAGECWGGFNQILHQLLFPR